MKSYVGIVFIVGVFAGGLAVHISTESDQVIVRIPGPVKIIRVEKLSEEIEIIPITKKTKLPMPPSRPSPTVGAVPVDFMIFRGTVIIRTHKYKTPEYVNDQISNLLGLVKSIDSIKEVDLNKLEGGVQEKDGVKYYPLKIKKKGK